MWLLFVYKDLAKLIIIPSLPNRRPPTSPSRPYSFVHGRIDTLSATRIHRAPIIFNPIPHCWLPYGFGWLADWLAGSADCFHFDNILASALTRCCWFCTTCDCACVLLGTALFCDWWSTALRGSCSQVDVDEALSVPTKGLTLKSEMCVRFSRSRPFASRSTSQRQACGQDSAYATVYTIKTNWHCNSFWMVWCM